MFINLYILFFKGHKDTALAQNALPSTSILVKKLNEAIPVSHC